jgi:hypothetical protein
LQLSAAARGTGETKKAAQTAFGKQALTMQLFHLGGMVSDRCRPHQVQRFEAAIAQRSSPGSLPTVLLHLDQVQTDVSVRAWHCFVRYGWPKTGGVYGVCCDVSALRGAVIQAFTCPLPPKLAIASAYARFRQTPRHLATCRHNFRARAVLSLRCPKKHSLAIVIRCIIQARGHCAADPRSKRRLGRGSLVGTLFYANAHPPA